MVARYRNKTDIVAHILQAAQAGPVTKTQIMYKTFISYEQLKTYLPLLTESGLLENGYGKDAQYATTEKGIKLLKMYDKILEFVPMRPASS